MARVLKAIKVELARVKEVDNDGTIHDKINGDTQPTSASNTIPEAASSWDSVTSRSEHLEQLRSQCATELEYEIESSKEHWTELDSETSSLSREELVAANREVFERLMEQWRCPETGQCFFHDWGDSLKVGEKIAEGGQAEIFAAELQNDSGPRSHYDEIVVKVFKSGYALKDLERQWPQGMLNQDGRKDAQITRSVHRTQSQQGEISTHFIHEYCCFIHGGTLLTNGRFAFVLGKYWGDLRKLIDLKRRKSTVYLFRSREVLGKVMLEIAQGMLQLHGRGILHRDLKASNVLVQQTSVFEDCFSIFENFDLNRYGYFLDVADFESSVGVVGTGFWRAPEVLHALKNQTVSPQTWTEASDVYSYAMTCYEIMTGRIPFEDGGMNVHNVINGARPLWNGSDIVDYDLHKIVISGWHSNPLERPSFSTIVRELKQRYGSRDLELAPFSPQRRFKKSTGSSDEVRTLKLAKFGEWEI